MQVREAVRATVLVLVRHHSQRPILRRLCRFGLVRLPRAMGGRTANAVECGSPGVADDRGGTYAPAT